MNPKEKAIELYSMYYNKIEHTLSEEYSPHEKDIVKQCALVAVDELIKWDDACGGMSGYLIEVKEEIDKL